MTTNTNSNSTRILIPFDIVEDHLHCSICLSVIRGAVLTPCGHRYCNKCISEWTGRNHTCPCCNSNLTTAQFYFDVQFDSLVDQILLARDEAEEAHFNRMFNEESINATEENNNSPFQDIFRKHLKASLISFDRYFHKLHEDHSRQIRILEASLQGNSPEKEEKKNALQEKLKLSEKLAADSFDRYISTNIPSFELLPVTVSVYVIDKKIRIPNIVLKPSDSLTSIQSPIEAYMQQRQDSIVKWADQGEHLYLVGPLAKSDVYQLENLTNGCTSCVELSWKSQPVFEHNLLPGSEILLHASFRSQSDLPKQCFVQVFQEKGSHAVDYFSCQNCNVKWICKSCSQACHAGHTIVPFALNHSPTWACCYCPKKKLCKIMQTGAQGIK